MIDGTLHKEAVHQVFPARSDGTQGLFVPTVSFIRHDEDKLSALIGSEAINAFRDPWATKNIVDSGYGNFRLQPKQDIVCDDDSKSWSFLVKRRIGEERVTCEAAVREYFRALFERLDTCELEHLHQSPLYIGKPAYSELALEQRYVRRITQICSDLGFAKPPVFVYEPYAVMYYCQQIARMEFPPPGKRRRTKILIVDHGGGTLSTCIVELNSEGRLDPEAKPIRPISKEDSGGRKLDEFILRDLIEHSALSSSAKEHLMIRSRPSFPGLDHALLSVEAAKIECVEHEKLGKPRPISIKIETGIPAVGTIRSEITTDVIRGAFRLLWDARRADTVSHTVGGESSAPSKIHHVILSGGTCRTGLHQEFLEKHYGAYFDEETRFVDVSTEKIPVSKGIGYQAVLDYVKGNAVGSKIAEVAAKEDLAETVARDLYLRLESDVSDHDVPTLIGHARLVHAGASKPEIWDQEQVVALTLKQKLPYRFRLAIGTDRSSAEIDRSNERVITVRKSERGHSERTTKVTMLVNSEGTCYPRIAIAPTKNPRYWEPDKKSFHFSVPDLIKAIAAHKPAEKHAPVNVLLLDFGSAVSCLCSVDLAEAFQRQSKDEALSDEIPVYRSSLFSGQLSLRAQSDTLDRHSQRLISALSRIDRELGNRFEQFMLEFEDVTAPSDLGQATALRTCIERTMIALAPEGALRKAGWKPEAKGPNRTTIYSKRQRVDWAMKCRSNPHPTKVADIKRLLGDVVTNVYGRASEITHGTVSPERREIERILNLWKAALFELLDV